MGGESSGMVGFDLGPLLEGQMRTAKLKSAYNLLIIGPRGFGASSLRWIQFASVFRCARSSSHYTVVCGVCVYRAKEEQVERKKAEDKSRRDQIFQEYLKRKEEREAEEELTRAGSMGMNVILTVKFYMLF